MESSCVMCKQAQAVTFSLAVASAQNVKIERDMNTVPRRPRPYPGLDQALSQKKKGLSQKNLSQKKNTFITGKKGFITKKLITKKKYFYHKID